MAVTSQLKLAYIADDFTGATDALEALCLSGMRAALFLEAPTNAVRAHFQGLDAIGVASDSRAVTVAELKRDMPGILQRMRALGAPLLHYKVCSTFDSSSETGNIGAVISLAHATLGVGFSLVVGGTPALGRYCVFGNLFAKSGTDGQVHRLDRHPIMSVHPITPMHEADLTRHIGAQADLSLGNVAFTVMDQGPDAVIERISELRRQGFQAAVIDGLTDAHLNTTGQVLNTLGKPELPVFVVGGSGVEYAVASGFQPHPVRATQAEHALPQLEAVAQVLAISGSGSALSAEQIQHALDAGFVEVAVNAAELISDAQPTRKQLIQEIEHALATGRSVMVHTVMGGGDPRVRQVREVLESQGHDPLSARQSSGMLLAREIGIVVAEVVRRCPVERLLVSGGDTSSQVAKALAPDAIVVKSLFVRGAPLCKTVYTDGRPGMEVCFKGGQLGQREFFTQALRGMAAPA